MVDVAVDSEVVDVVAAVAELVAAAVVVVAVVDVDVVDTAVVNVEVLLASSHDCTAIASPNERFHDAC